MGSYHAQDPLIVPEPKHPTKRPRLDPPKKKPKGPHPALPPMQIDKPKETKIVVRRYQMEILAKAMQVNTIVYLETGCGKTLIAVLLLKNLACIVKGVGKKFTAVFLAPTVCLVGQQTQVLKINTDLQVDSYYGAKGVDFWKEDTWKAEIEKNEILVMTPQVLLDALRHGFLKMESFELLIMDECHQAQKQHAYAKIMREFYHTLSSKKPKIFGMTASPVTKKGVSSMTDSAHQMQRLESLLDAQVYTLEDRNELEHFVPTPVLKKRYYDVPVNSHEVIINKLNAIKDECEVCDYCFLTEEGKPCFKDDEEVAKKLVKKIRKLHGNLCYCIEELGVWCAYEACHCLLQKVKKDSPFEAAHPAVRARKQAFLTEAQQVLEYAFPELRLEQPTDAVKTIPEAVEKGLLTPKASLLVDCLVCYKDVADLHCIVFVERVVAAMVLPKLAGIVSSLSFLKCGFLAGMTASVDVMGRKQQQSTLQQFREGQLNVLVATDVAEEGLDVQSCSSVIRFDLPKSVRSNIQSRGRARRPGSDYVIFLQKGCLKQEDQLKYLMDSEESMRAQALNRASYPASLEKDRVEDLEIYHVESTGATVNTDSSISLLTRFCSNLPGDRYYKPQPEFIFETIQGDDSLHVCRLRLPPNGPFREVVGPPKKSCSLAKQSVCLEACRRLHMMGHLTDNLVPVIDAEKSEEEEVMNLGGKNTAGAGTNKRKELHPTMATLALQGSWVDSTEDIELQAYLISFSFVPDEEDPYSDFVFLSSTVIDDDISNTEIRLYMTNNRIADATISAAGKYCLSPSQLKDAKLYHELMYNGLYGKLLKPAKKAKSGSLSKMQNLLAAPAGLDELWSNSNMYLLLPLHAGVQMEESEMILIDWDAVRSCATSAKIFSTLYSDQEISGNINRQPSDQEMSEDINRQPCIMSGNNILEMASGASDISKVKGMAVVAIHTGRVYSVVDVLMDMNANCPFLSGDDAENRGCSTYIDYFKEKYGKLLKFPHQPLLQVKQSHRLHNLLTQQSASKERKGSSNPKRAVYVEMPPELCLLIGVSNAVIRSLYLIPSVLHRFNALLLAGQLRSNIVKEMPHCALIQPRIVMEALTTLRCLEGFSLEGLELLGDSFLKYAVSRYLFLVYEKKHEGQLSARRSRAICNEKLHCLAIKRGLPGYIRDEPFHPEFWSAPGMKPAKTVKCKCNRDNLTHFLTEDSAKQQQDIGRVFRIGMTCSEGHRWICSKTISDMVEALIGAYIVSGSSGCALGFMKWMGMEIDFDLSLYKDARERTAVHPNVLRGVNISGLEAQLGYSFSNKSLLVEALTHASQQDLYEGCCYQRLEFLGDAVLDFLITRHLFLAHPGLSPGILSDLRSAAVNNECFARAAVKHNLQRYLRHGSGELLSQITSFVRSVQMLGDEGQDQSFGWEGVRGPKVLGDLIESIAGAITVDSGFDLDTVWGVMEGILSPIVTPSTLPLQPIRELHELSQYERFSITWKQTGTDGNAAFATVEVELKTEVITETAWGRHLKSAKKDAARQVLIILNQRGIVHPRRVLDQAPLVTAPSTLRHSEASHGEKHQFDGDACASDEKRPRRSCDSTESVTENVASVIVESNCLKENEGAEMIMSGMIMSAGGEVGGNGSGNVCVMDADGGQVPSLLHEPLRHELDMTGRDSLMIDSSLEVKVSDSTQMAINVMRKGSGRSHLHDYCSKRKWRSVYVISLQEGVAHSQRFTYSVEVQGPPSGPIKVTGDSMPNKKAAMDSAAIQLLKILKNSPSCA